MTPRHSAGSVTLVGGGPGAADLMTVRARDALAAADVVLHDRLAPREDLHAWAPHAQLIDVGKRPGRHRVPQETITRLLVSAALDGHHAVRLKGGDPGVFARGTEEITACRTAGVPVTVVPGITTAIAVPAAAGIPVTARGVSKAVTVVSGHDPLAEAELAGLVGLGGTVVVLMGVGTMDHTVSGLQRHGMAPRTPAAIVEQGFGTDQRTTIAPLAELLTTAAERGIAAPAVLVIGDVVALAADEPGTGEAPVEAAVEGPGRRRVRALATAVV